VDDIINPEEIVVRSLGEHFAEMSLYTGAAILGDGEPVLILDVTGMARFAGVQAALDVDLTAADRARTEQKSLTDGYLVFETSGQMFAVGIRGVPWIAAVPEPQIESFQGVNLVRLRGEAIPIARLDKLYDLPAQSDPLVHLLVFSIGGRNAAIAASVVHNVSSEITNIQTDRISGRGVSGHTVHNGRMTIVLDAEALLGSLLDERFVSLSDIKETV
ncbi:MAG: chemotaxis protein CheW, partial [Spirochaetia bacterium]|nr:chemotaxis protein CheW [Spirochaetia bacterium]